MFYLLLFGFLFFIDAPQLRISYGTNIARDAIREGSDVYLECAVRANPAIKEVVWLHEGRPMHTSLGHNHHHHHSTPSGDSGADNSMSGADEINRLDQAIGSSIIMTNQSLVIQKVHRTHRGRYQCAAFNDQGETLSDMLSLKVNCKHKLSLFF